MSGLVEGVGSVPDLETAGAVIMDRLGVTSRDAVLIVCNKELPHAAELVNAVAGAARARSERVAVQEYPAGSRDGEEPPATVAAAMRKSTAVILLTRFSISHTKARMEATRGGARIASMPGVRLDTFVRALPADYDQLRLAGESLAKQLTIASSCRVTTSAGTDVVLSLHDRTAIVDDGNLQAPGAFGNLPAGEAYIAPCEDAVSGTIVFDGSLTEWGILDRPLTVVLDRGRAVDIKGGSAAEWLCETLDAGGSGGRVIAELGIGTNRGARVSGDVLEDEKAAGTIHFAFGNNLNMGGLNEASVHLDALVLRPHLELDGVVMLDEGLPLGFGN